MGQFIFWACVIGYVIYLYKTRDTYSSGDIHPVIKKRY